MTDSSKNELDAINRTLKGQRNAFRPLVERYYSAVKIVLSRYVKNEYEIEDLCQETFVRAYNKLDTFKQEAKFSSWIIKIAINTALESLRKNSVPLSPYVQNFGGQSNSNEPFERIYKDLLFDQCLKGLSFNYQILFVLRHGLDFSCKEIANLLDTSEGSIKTDLYRIRLLLKNLLSDSKPEKSNLCEAGEQNETLRMSI